MSTFIHTLLAATSFAAAAAPSAANPSAPQAQALVDRAIAENPDVLDILFHVTPPGTLRNRVIAAHLAKDLGEISGDDDLGVARTARPLVEVQKDGVRIGVLLQMRDARHRGIGAVGITFPWHKGDRKETYLARARGIRDRLAARIPSRDSLFS